MRPSQRAIHEPRLLQRTASAGVPSRETVRRASGWCKEKDLFDLSHVKPQPVAASTEMMKNLAKWLIL